MTVLRTTMALVGVGAGVATAAVGLTTDTAFADSGVIGSGGGDHCSGQWITNGHNLRIRDNDSEGHYCYIDYGTQSDVSNGGGKRISNNVDQSVGSWVNHSNVDMTGIPANGLYFQVCEERPSNPDTCSSVHGAYATK